eukprot:Clim_evm121s109 gene=Clim_evmTU121s109
MPISSRLVTRLLQGTRTADALGQSTILRARWPNGIPTVRTTTVARFHTADQSSETPSYTDPHWIMPTTGHAIDGMPRYPSLISAGGMLRGFDYLGTAAFAVGGTLTASAFGMDAFGCTAVATITAVGGGSVRDVLLGRRAFWFDEPEYIYIAVVCSMLTFALWSSENDEDTQSLHQPRHPGVDRKHLSDVKQRQQQQQQQGSSTSTLSTSSNGVSFRLEREEPRNIALELGDALGVGAFGVIGCQNALRCGLASAPLLCVMCGVMTATFGGMTRDVLTGGGKPRILRSDKAIYATTAAVSAITYLLARTAMPALHAPRVIFGVLSGTLLRLYSDRYGVTLPKRIH